MKTNLQQFLEEEEKKIMYEFRTYPKEIEAEDVRFFIFLHDKRLIEKIVEMIDALPPYLVDQLDNRFIKEYVDKNELVSELLKVIK